MKFGQRHGSTSVAEATQPGVTTTYTGATQLGPFVAIADGVWRAVAEPESVTVGLVVGAEGALVVDTGSTSEQGAAIRRAAEAVAEVPISAVAVTHNHYDHVGGIAAFTDVPVYGHASVTGVTIGFELARVIELGGRRVELIHFGPAHTGGDIVAIVPDADLVFVGDLLESAGPPSIEPESSLIGWPKALDGVLGVLSENSVVVPGHGPTMDRIASFEQRGRIANLLATTQWLIIRGIDLDSALTATEWPFPEEVIKPLLPRLWAETST